MTQYTRHLDLVHIVWRTYTNGDAHTDYLILQHEIT
jgi:hypothetical protein